MYFYHREGFIMRSKTFSRSRLSIAIRTAIVGSGTALALASTPVVQANEVEDMKLEVQQLMQRIDKLESKQQANKAIQNPDAKQQAVVVQEPDIGEKVYTASKPAKSTKRIRNANHQIATTADEDPLSFKLGQSDTTVSVSGYVKLDAFIDSDQDVGDSFVFSSIVPDGDAASDRDTSVRLHARQSRFRIKSTTPMGGDEINTLIEGDFYGVGGNQSFSNSTSFRLRHAWITYGNWGFGQTWSNFMENNFVAYPGTVDFFGPVGQAFVRAPQIRYTANNGFSIAIENPETDGVGAAGRLRESTGGLGADETPDVTVAWRGGPGGAGGSYEFASVFRTLGVKADTTGDGKNDFDEDDSGFGWMAAGGWQVGGAYLYAHLNGGDGIGRYIINGFANDVFIDANGNLDTVESLGGNVGVTFDVGDDDNINIVYGFFENDEPDESNGIDELTSLHVAYINNIGGGL
jgi:hypothetical protein